MSPSEAPIEAPLDTSCECPVWCSPCPYLEALEKLNTIKVTVSRNPPIDSSKTPIIWVLGGPGCGKGTQCEKIVAKYGFTHLSTGDLLRAEMATGSELAKSLAEIMKRGGLVPTEQVLHLVKKEMQSKAATSKGYLVDGYPREKSQGHAFEEAIAPVTAILYFEVSEPTLRQRLMHRAQTSGRSDDNEKTINLRLKTFFENKHSVLEQYPDKINVINAETTIDEIFADVQKVMDPIVAAAAARAAQ